MGIEIEYLPDTLIHGDTLFGDIGMVQYVI